MTESLEQARVDSEKLREELATQARLIEQVGKRADVLADRVAKNEQQLGRAALEAVVAEGRIDTLTGELADERDNLEATEKSLSTTQAELATRERLLVAVGKQVDEGKRKQAAMGAQLVEAALRKRQLEADVERLEKSLAQQSSLVEKMGKIAASNKAEGEEYRHQLEEALQAKRLLASELQSTKEALALQIRLVKSVGDAAQEGKARQAEMAAQLRGALEDKRRLSSQGEQNAATIADLESMLSEGKSRVEALEIQLEREKQSAAEQLEREKQAAAEQTQRIRAEEEAKAALLAAELETSQRAARDSQAVQRLTEDRLKAAVSEVSKVLASKREAEFAVRQKTLEVDELKANLDELKDMLVKAGDSLEFEQNTAMESRKAVMTTKAETKKMIIDLKQEIRQGETALEELNLTLSEVEKKYQEEHGARDKAERELEEVKQELAEVTFNFSRMQLEPPTGSPGGEDEGEWVRAYDAATESHYWLNSKTQEAAWEKV